MHAMETHRHSCLSDAKRRGRSLNRTPLSDLNNAPAFSSSSITMHSRKPPAPHLPPNGAIPVGACSGEGASAASNAWVLEISSRDRRSRKISSEIERFAANIINSNCSPMEDIGSVNRDKKIMDGLDALPQMLPIPSQKQKKKRLHRKSETKEITDYIMKQRAYFAEIDAFELSEEVVSDNDLE